MCLANGDPHYVPPASALRFAICGRSVMRVLYGENVDVVDVEGCSRWFETHRDSQVEMVVPWGWDMRVVAALDKCCWNKEFIPSTVELPGNEWLVRLRHFQHRKSFVPLQKHAEYVESLESVRSLVLKKKRVVLKAPLSGAGRGLRWIDESMSQHDENWVSKTISMQNGVVVEERLDVAEDFALEFMFINGVAHLTGYSLFKTQGGVYRNNILLYDNEIKERVGIRDGDVVDLKRWLMLNMDFYRNGPVGIDMMKTRDGRIVVGEINVRHTMGMVAHEFLKKHPERHGSLWSPQEMCTDV